ncbi:vacuolar protein sorting-associated protein 37A-like [Babylonia areolata]|uniref:vacuolar protein sorting-associated protein 37A-like n=1 Tax=Babylonia areolata TaxID=304850 RepID=UPI003FD06144
MHKLFGGKAKPSAATNLQIQKTKQIESLRKVSAIEILRDVEYRVILRSGTNSITLIIALTAQFPQDKPIISVTPPVTHPWVDPQSLLVTGCPSVNNFSMHSDLGQAVQVILDEFKKNPPVPVSAPSFGAAPPYPMGPPPGYAPPGYIHPGSEPYPQGVGATGGAPPVPPRLQSGSLSNGSAEGGADSEGFPDFTMPDVMKSFPQLKDKKLMELQELIDNEEQLLEMVQGLPELKAFAEKREALSEQCVFLARSNLSQKPKIKDMKEELAEKMASYDELRGGFEAKCEQHMRLSEQFQPSLIQTNLKVAILQAEEESENIMQDFLAKKLEVEDFVQQFLEKRKLCHLRKAKEEKLSHIILSQGDQY